MSAGARTALAWSGLLACSLSACSGPTSNVRGGKDPKAERPLDADELAGIECWDDDHTCRVQSLDERALARLGRVADRDALWVVFEDPTPEELATVSRAPWIKHLQIDVGERITGLEAIQPLAKTLVSLTLGSIRLSSLEPLAAFTSLEELELGYPYGVADTDLHALVGLTGLRSLAVSGLEIQDWRDLAKLEKLEKLTLDTGLPDFDLLRFTPKLKSLAITRKGPAHDLAPVGALTELEVLGLDAFETLDTAPIGSLEKLTSLRIASSEIEALPPLAPNLKELSLRDDPNVKDLAPLAAITSLEVLDVSGTRVADLAPLSNLPALRKLDISETRVVKLDALANVKTLELVVVPSSFGLADQMALRAVLPRARVEPGPPRPKK